MSNQAIADRECLSRCKRVLQRYHSSSLIQPISLFAYRLSGYLVGVTCIMLSANALLLGVATLVTMYYAGRLFEVAHDAAHGSFTPSWCVNRIIGRIAFLPSLHAFELWRFSHNVLHHRYTNLRGKDFVWVPLACEEYAALSRASKAFYRLSRNRYGAGLGLYYLVELWAKKLILPAVVPERRNSRIAWCDFCGVCLFAIALMLAAGISSLAQGEIQVATALLRITLSCLVPFLYVCWMIGFVVYFNHTHPDIPWHDNVREWSHARAQIEETVHLGFKIAGYRFGPNAIMCHTAHHIDPLVPLYRLEGAQARLNTLLGERVVCEAFSFRRASAILATCKLYDYGDLCWRDYRGQMTSRPACQSIVAGQAAAAAPAQM